MGNPVTILGRALVVAVFFCASAPIALGQEPPSASVEAQADTRAQWDALNDQLIAAYNSSNYAQGISLGEAALALAETAFGAEHPDTLISVNNLAALYRAQGLYGQAEPLYLRALEARERVLGKEHPSTLRSVNNLAGLYNAQGLYGQAEPLYLRALEARERVLGKEHPDTLISVNNLAALYDAQGLYGQAEPLYLRALEASERVLGKEHPSTLISVNNLAGLYDSQGLYGQAEPLYLRALEARERVLGKEHPDTLNSVNNLAFLYQAQGLYGQAEPLYLRALDARERVQGKEHPSTLISVNNLAALYRAQGLYGQAEPLYLRALEASERVLGKEHPDTLISVNNLAALYDIQGLYGQAEPLYLRALEARERVLGKEHPSTLTSVNNLAFLYNAQGLYGKAEPLYLRALDARERVLGKEHPDTLTSVNNLAAVYYAQGLYGHAEQLYLRAMTTAERILGEHHVNMATYYSNQASLLHAGFDAAPAAIYYQKRAVNVIQSVRAELSELQESTQSAFLEKNRDVYETLQQWLIEAGRFAEAEQVGRMLKEQEYFEFIRRSEAGDDPRQTRSELTAREAEWEAQLAAWAERPNRVAVELAALKDRQRGGAQLTALEAQQLADLETEYDVAYAAYKTEVDDWLASVRALSDDVIQEEAQALEAKFHDDLQGEIADIGADVAALQIVAFEDRLHFFLITPGAFKHVETEVSRAELYEAIFATRDALGEFTPASRGGGPVEADSTASGGLTPALQNLYDLLLAPVRQELEDAGTQTLMLNLQGPIRYAPFAALHDGEQYLTERFGLALFTPAARTRYQSAGSITDATGFGVSKEHEGFSPLPAVTRELEQLFPGEDGAGVLSGKIYPDEAFTRAAFEVELEDSSPILHIASHFSMQPGDNTNSFLLLGDGNRLTLEDIHLSSDIRFRGVELLTLSACSTAISGEASGAEIEGLGSLAQRKGAEAVVATLWNVADDATATFMERFYGGLSSGDIDKARALQAAQVSMIEDPDTAHPYYWAPYILMGNWK